LRFLEIASAETAGIPALLNKPDTLNGTWINPHGVFSHGRCASGTDGYELTTPYPALLYATEAM
jgi:hypothetical protein